MKKRPGFGKERRRTEITTLPNEKYHKTKENEGEKKPKNSRLGTTTKRSKTLQEKVQGVRGGKE